MPNALELPVGNDAVRAALLKALRSERLAHSILLYAQPGCGAGFAARCLAADFLYPDQADSPQAMAVLEGIAPELLVLRGTGASGEIKADDVRRVRRSVFDTALSADGRVVLIYGAQSLNAASANALLKVLEEPPPNVIFILTASQPQAVLPTIRSRCCAYRLAPLSVQQCLCEVQRRGMTPPHAQLLCRALGGALGRVLRVLEQPEQRVMFEQVCALAAQVQRGDLYACLVALARFEGSRVQARCMLELFYAVCAAAMQGQYEVMSQQCAANSLVPVQQAMERLAAHMNVRLALTLLAAQLCSCRPTDEG